MTAVFVTPQEAEEAFYDAFERRDLASMMEVWADDERVVCIHPGSERLEGPSEVAESWRHLFAADGDMQFELSDEQYTQDALLAIHTVRENIAVDGRLQGSVLATNIYQLVEGGWRMILHHASPASSARVVEQPDTVLH